MEELSVLRSQHPAVLRHIYLNTGTAGPLSRAVADALAAEARIEWEEGRLHRGFERYLALLGHARSRMAALLGVSAESVALTTSTGDGLNVILNGLPWKAGEEILTTDAEHESSLLPAAVLAQRQGVVVRFATLPTEPELAGEALARALTSRTRLLMLSHVSYSTGALLPLKALVEAAHSQGVLVLVDGAQSFAATNLELAESGVDFYAVSGQKWLCGPEGTGALYVRRELLDRVAPTFLGYYSVATCGEHGEHELWPEARRFEVGSRYLPAVAGQAAAVTWFLEQVGPDRAYHRIALLAKRLLQGLSAIPGVRVATPASAHAGLVSFEAANRAPEEIVAALTKGHNILCRSVPWTRLVRFSTGWYNTEEEVDQALAAVAAVLG